MNSVGRYENVARGTIDFPMEHYMLNSAHINYIMKYHWHMDWEFIRINTGKFKVSINENNILLNKGDILIIPGGILHGGEPEAGCEYECVVLHSSIIYHNNRAIKELIKSNINFSVKLDRKINSDLCYTADLFFNSVRDKNYGYEPVAAGALTLLIGRIIESNLSAIKGTEREISSKRIDNIKGALKLIEEEYNSEITLERLARTCGMSPRYFCEFFKDMTGRTPIEYLNRYRIECACNMLSNMKMNVTETATSCGFNDISYFIRTFKKYIGVTPKKYSGKIIN